MGQTMGSVVDPSRDDNPTAGKRAAQIGVGAALGGLKSLSQRNAASWNAPGGGYQQWQSGDQQREQQFPIGTPVNNPALPPVSGARKPINPFYGQ